MSESGDSTPVLLTHPLDSQDVRNAALLAAEAAEDAEDAVQEINTDIEAALQAERKKKQNEQLLAAIQQALQGNTEAMELFGADQLALHGEDHEDSEHEHEHDDEEDEQPAEDAPQSFVSWARSALLPTSLSSLLTRRSLTAYSKYYALKAGRYAWNAATASALVLLPIMIASSVEDTLLAQHLESASMQQKLAELEQRGIVPAMPSAAAYALPSMAPQGYTPPPADVAGIPSQ